MKTSTWRRGEDNLKKRWREAEKSGTSDKGDLSLTCSSLMSMFCLSAGRWKWKPPLGQDVTRCDKMWQEMTRGDKRWQEVRTSWEVADEWQRWSLSPPSRLSLSFLSTFSLKRTVHTDANEFCTHQVVACQNGQNLRISKFDNRTIRCYYRVQKIALCSPFTQNYEETFLLWKHSKCVFLHLPALSAQPIFH